MAMFLAGCGHASRPDPARGLRTARLACTEMQRVEDGVRDNISSRTVLADVSRAKAHAKAARKDDAHWVRLESGVQTIDLALRHNSGFAANQGIRVVHDVCAEVRASA